MMKQVLLAGVAATAFASASYAADLPTRKAPPAPYVPAVLPFTWSGFYVGATAGANWNTGHTHVDSTLAGAPLGAPYAPTSFGDNNVGAELGGEVGYNYQIGNVVIGLEDDLQWLSGNKSSTFTGATLPAAGGALATTESYKIDWLGTTRGRLGLATLDQGRLLLFVTGGLAYGGGNSSLSVSGPAGQSWYGSSNSTQIGWTVGGGAEYAFTNNWSVKAEYLYYNLENFSYAAAPNAAAAATGAAFTARVHPEGSIARVGLNYKF